MRVEVYGLLLHVTWKITSSYILLTDSQSVLKGFASPLVSVWDPHTATARIVWIIQACFKLQLHRPLTNLPY